MPNRAQGPLDRVMSYVDHASIEVWRSLLCLMVKRLVAVRLRGAMTCHACLSLPRTQRMLAPFSVALDQLQAARKSIATWLAAAASPELSRLHALRKRVGPLSQRRKESYTCAAAVMPASRGRYTLIARSCMR